MLSREQLVVLSARLCLILWLSHLLHSRSVPSNSACTPIVWRRLLFREQVILVGWRRQLLPPCFILLWRWRLLLLLLLLIQNIRILSICLVQIKLRGGDTTHWLIPLALATASCILVYQLSLGESQWRLLVIYREFTGCNILPVVYHVSADHVRILLRMRLMGWLQSLQVHKFSIFTTPTRRVILSLLVDGSGRFSLDAFDYFADLWVAYFAIRIVLLRIWICMHLQRLKTWIIDDSSTSLISKLELVLLSLLSQGCVSRSRWQIVVVQTHKHCVLMVLIFADLSRPILPLLLLLKLYFMLKILNCWICNNW